MSEKEGFELYLWNIVVGECSVPYHRFDFFIRFLLDIRIGCQVVQSTCELNGLHDELQLTLLNIYYRTARGIMSSEEKQEKVISDL